MSRIARLWRALVHHRRPLFLAQLSGILFAASFCGYDQDYLGWFCLAPLIWALESSWCTTWRRALAYGWMMGFFAHLGVYTWLVGMLRDFGYLPLPLAIVGYAFVCAIQSVLYAFFGAAHFWLLRRVRIAPVFAAPIAYVLVEWGTPALFPSYLANGQYRRIVLIQACAVWGVLGLSFVLALSSSVVVAVGHFCTGRRKFPSAGLASLTILVAGMMAYGYRGVVRLDQHVAQEPRTLRVGLVQANMGIYEKTLNRDEGLRRHREQSLEVEALGAELVIWSESGYYSALDPSVFNVKQMVMGRLHTPLLFGGMRIAYGPAGKELYNSAFITDPDGALRGTYDKTHLLAFGEFLPLGESLPWLYRLSPQSSHFHRGTHVTPLQFRGLKLGTLICYEDILPNFVRRAMTESPDILINLTNDAWFGNSNEPRIHLALATFRAVEQRRFLVRATNTGISAIIDPAGRVLHETPVFVRANLVGDVKPMHGLTIYQVMGDWPGYGSLVFCLFWATRMHGPKALDEIRRRIRARRTRRARS